MSEINLVYYLVSRKVEGKKTERACAGAFGYSYDVSVVGKKKLQKDVPTTVGYYVGNTTSNGTVVEPIDSLSVVVSDRALEIEAQLDLLKVILEDAVEHEDVKNIGLIGKYPLLEKLLTVDPSKIVEKEYKLGKTEFNKEAVKSLTDIQALMDKLKGRSKLVFNFTLSVEGGMGPKMAWQSAGIAEVETVWGMEPIAALYRQPMKTFLNPESDFNRIICGSRWYFNTGEGNDFYELKEGYRRYGFGKVEKDKKYYGKLTPDVTYSSFYTQTPIALLDKLYDYTEKRTHNPKGLMLAGNMQFVRSKEIARLIDNCPGVVREKDLIVPFRMGSQDEPTLVELIDPPGLTYRISDVMEEHDIILHSFLNKDEFNKFGQYQKFYDITNIIFEKLSNKKGEIKLKLQPDFTQNTQTFKVNVEHRKAVKAVPITLSVGYDLPERNAFNSVKDPDVQVWVNIDEANDGCLIYRIIVKAEDWIYIHASGCANVRVLNKAELGRKD